MSYEYDFLGLGLAFCSNLASKKTRPTPTPSLPTLTCSGSMISDTDLGGTFTTADEVFYDKTTSIVFN